jgi:nitrite reductase (NO-forming)
MIPTSRREMLQVLGLGGTAAVAGCLGTSNPEATEVASDSVLDAAEKRATESVAADPTELPDPIDRDSPETVEIELEIQEVVSEIDEGKTFKFLTYNGQIPGPMVRVRQGDTVKFNMVNPPESDMSHNVDFHAVYGTGGGSVATTASPGEANGMEFTVEYPGAYIYHCAVPRLDYHISAGMFGMIVVEPEEGLPPVDRELYFGQHEVYTKGGDGHQEFDREAMKAEDPNYVLFNGEAYAYAADKHGPLAVDRGDTVRVFLVDGGPNLSSNFHPIGNVWARAYRDGGLPESDVEGAAEHNVQTMKVPPGSCMIGEMETPVPERIHLVDHALSRVRHKGTLADIDVRGEEQPDVFDPSPETPADQDEEGPIY